MASDHEPRSAVFAYLLLLAGTATALFAPAIFRGETFTEHDLSSYHRPMRSVLVRLLASHSGLPVWNPYSASGQPFAANPVHTPFHPLSILFFVLPFDVAFNLEVILPAVASVAAMFLLLRTLGTSRAAAVFGSMSWGFGGYVLSATHLYPLSSGLAPAPAVLAFALRLLRDPSARHIAAVALSFGLVALAGEPASLLGTAMLLTVALGEGLLRGPAHGPQGGRQRPRLPAARSLLLLAGALALGGAVAAVTLVPGLNLAAKTVRADGLDPEQAGLWSMPPLRALEVVVPRLLGHTEGIDDSLYWGRSLYPVTDFPYIHSIYAGLLVAVLAVVAASSRPRQIGPWAVVGVAGFLVAIGTHFPLWGWLRQVPPISGIRFPEKFIFLPLLGCAVAGALGFDLVCRDAPGARRMAARWLGGIAAAGVAFILAVLGLDRWAGPGIWLGLQIRPHVVPQVASVLVRDGVLLTLLALSYRASIALLGRAGGRTGQAALLLLAAVDLILSGRRLVPTEPVAQVDAMPGFLRLAQEVNHDGARLFHYAAWDPRSQRDYGVATPPMPSQWGIATTYETDFEYTQLRWTHHATDLFWKAVGHDAALTAPLLARRGVGAVLAYPRGYTPPPQRTRHLLREAPLALVRISLPHPFLFCAEQVERVRGEAGWLEAVQHLGDRLRSTAIVDQSEAAGLPLVPSRCSLSRVEQSPPRIVADLDVAGPGDAVLAINQTWDSDWRARVDGRLVRLVRTDISLQAVVVPPGRHRLELDYADPSIAWGLLISGVALACCFVLVLVQWRPGVRPGAGEP